MIQLLLFLSQLGAGGNININGLKFYFAKKIDFLSSGVLIMPCGVVKVPGEYINLL